MSARSKPMTDQEYIEFCYERVLGRVPDNEGKIYWTNVLRSHQYSREEILIQFITSNEFGSRVANLEFVPSGHFYSAVPSIEERESFVSSVPSETDEVLGVNLNNQKQMELLEQFKIYHDKCPFPEHKTDPFRYYSSNPAYPYADALTLYSMIREFKPKRIIEVGSGFSSCVMLDTNDLLQDNGITFTFIDPYPELLHSLIKKSDRRHTIIPKRVQDVDMNIFTSLKASDFLFIDSTHVSKLNSDVNKIIFEILPSLRIGVLIHFHDIFWKFEYPKQWVREGRAWNEVYLLRAFLEYNASFEILFFSDYLIKYHRKWIEENMPLYLKSTSGNLWLRKLMA